MTTYEVPEGPKMLRETICVAQTYVGLSGLPRAAEHIARLQRLIDECDRHRPVGPDGKHDDRHTPTCGCDELQGSVFSQPGARALANRRGYARAISDAAELWALRPSPEHERSLMIALAELKAVLPFRRGSSASKETR